MDTKLILNDIFNFIEVNLIFYIVLLKLKNKNNNIINLTAIIDYNAIYNFANSKLIPCFEIIAKNKYLLIIKNI